MKTGTVIKNLWAGYEAYFICMNFPVRSYRNEGRKVGGFSLCRIDGKWEFGKAEYYTNYLKDTEHYPIVGNIDVCKMFVDAISELTNDRILPYEGGSMNTEKYKIENVGCDDVTVGVLDLTQEEFQILSRVFEELNKNSFYNCMPKIYIKRWEQEEV